MPTITRTECYETDSIVLQLEIEGFWLLTARWPRIALTWWILKMVWRERKVNK